MPQAALISSALYAVPTLATELLNLGYLPGAPGYAELLKEHGADLNRPKPTVRTVQKMLLQGDLVKYSMCDGIIRLLNVARSKQQLDLLSLDSIEEHEFHIENLEQALAQIRRTKSIGASEIRANIARDCKAPVALIRAMGKGYRTTRDRCELVRESLGRLYGQAVSISNRPFIVRPSRNRRESTRSMATPSARTRKFANRAERTGAF